MKLSIIALAVMATSSAAMADINLPKQDKSGVGVHAGFSVLSGDIGTIAANYGDSTGLSLGLEYTTKNGIIFGLMHTPELASAKDTYYYYSSYSETAAFEVSTTSVYVGYETDKGLRITGGLTKATLDAKLYNNIGDSVSGSDDSIAPNFGIGYQFKNGIYADGRIAFMDLVGVSNTQGTASIGYKF